MWLYPTPPREAACYATVSARHDRSTRPLRPDALVLSVAAKTALQPRPRCAPTLPAQPHHRPHRVEHEDTRAGARHLCAALATRSGQVSGRWDERKRQREGLAFLQTLEPEIDESIRTMHLVCAHVSPQHGQDVRIWFNHQPRVVVHFPPGHGSWMNHVEPWFSLLPRQRLCLVAGESKDHLRAQIAQCIQAWTHHAPPFNWPTNSVAKVRAAAPALAA